jgi:anti-sigma factor RsiW
VAVSGHVADRLAALAAGGLDAAEARAVEEHLRECAACAAEHAAWRHLAEELARLPAPRPAPALVGRTRAAVEAQLAERAERAWNRAALGFLVAFAWTLTVGAWWLIDLLRGELVLRLDAAVAPTAAWYGAYVVGGWLTAAAAAVLLGRRATDDEERRIA